MTSVCKVCGKDHPRGLGGTAMAKILGVHDLSGETAEDVYYDLTRPPLDAMDAIMPIDLLRGVTHEPVAAAFYFEKTGREGRKCAGAVTHPDFPAFQCHPDFDIFAKEGEDEFSGTGTLEVKCPRLFRFTQIVETGVRKAELIQLQTYTAVQRREWGSFAFYHMEHDDGPVLVVDQLADKALGDFLLKTGQRFFDEHVTPRIAPDPDEWAAELESDEAPAVTETMGALLFIPRDEIVDHEQIVEAARGVMAVTSVRKESEELEKSRKKAMKPLFEAAYDTDRIELQGIAKVTHVRQQGRLGFNRKSLEGHRPIDRDKFEAWLKDAPLERIEAGLADTLALDLSRFDKRGAPFSFLKITPKGEL